MKRDIWMESVSKYGCPAWPCPTCKKGTLSLDTKSLVYHETALSARSHRDDGWDPDWIDYRFTAWVDCGNPSCKQKVAISGDGGVEQVMTGDNDWDWEAYFRPSTWQPMPKIFEIPPKCPSQVKEELKAAFDLHAFQRAACAARLRVALEFLMDHVGVPRKKKNAQGKFVDQSLHARLMRFALSAPDIGAQLMALKWLGNAGSHDSEVSKKDLLDAMEIFEHALHEIIEKRSERVAKLARQLEKKYKR